MTPLQFKRDYLLAAFILFFDRLEEPAHRSGLTFFVLYFCHVYLGQADCLVWFVGGIFLGCLDLDVYVGVFVALIVVHAHRISDEHIRLWTVCLKLLRNDRLGHCWDPITSQHFFRSFLYLLILVDHFGSEPPHFHIRYVPVFPLLTYAFQQFAKLVIWPRFAHFQQTKDPLIICTVECLQVLQRWVAVCLAVRPLEKIYKFDNQPYQGLD